MNRRSSLTDSHNSAMVARIKLINLAREDAIGIQYFIFPVIWFCPTRLITPVLIGSLGSNTS